MNKTIIASLLASFLFAPIAAADWKNSLNESFDKAKNLISSAVAKSEQPTDNAAQPAPVEQAKPEPTPTAPNAAQVSVAENWEGIEKRFSKIIDLKAKQDEAPAKASLLKKDKADYQQDIDELLAQAFSLISDNDLNQFQIDLQQNKAKKKEEVQKLTELKRQAKLTFDPNEKADLEQDVTAQEQKITELDKQKTDILLQIKNRLNSFGNQINDEQIETLMLKVNANDILSMTSIFPVIAQFAHYLGEVTQDSGEDLVSAKKYYGMYVLLLELQLFIQDQYIDKLENQYIPQLDGFKKENLALISETKKLIKQANGRSKEIYANNLQSQEFTYKAINLYDAQLRSDLTKIQRAQNLLIKDYKVAVNTYKTVDLSYNVAQLINSNSKLFDEVINLQTPDLISFKNEKMKEEFAKLTEQMQKK